MSWHPDRVISETTAGAETTAAAQAATTKTAAKATTTATSAKPTGTSDSAKDVAEITRATMPHRTPAKTT